MGPRVPDRPRTMRKSSPRTGGSENGPSERRGAAVRVLVPRAHHTAWRWLHFMPI